VLGINLLGDGLRDILDPRVVGAIVGPSLRTGIGKDAQVWGESGKTDKAVDIALDLEQLIYEVNTFLKAPA
jgi:hypothetical protein